MNEVTERYRQTCTGHLRYEEIILASDSEDSCIFIDDIDDCDIKVKTTNSTTLPGKLIRKRLEVVADSVTTSELENSILCVDESDIDDSFQLSKSVGRNSTVIISSGNNSESGIISKNNLTFLKNENNSSSLNDNNLPLQLSPKNVSSPIYIQREKSNESAEINKTSTSMINSSKEINSNNSPNELGIDDQLSSKRESNLCKSHISSCNKNYSRIESTKRINENAEHMYCSIISSSSSAESSDSESENDEDEVKKGIHSSKSNNLANYNVTCRRINFSSDSESDDQLDMFLSKMKTMTEKKKQRRRLSWHDDFIDDDFLSDEEGFHLKTKQRLFPTKSTPVLSTPDSCFEPNNSQDDKNHRLSRLSIEPNAPVFGTPEPDAPVFSTPENCSNDDLFSSKANSNLLLKRTISTKSSISKSCSDFLSSLSPSIPPARRHDSVKSYFKNFKAKKKELARKIYDIFNENVFKNQLPHDMEIVWKPRLTKTAGLCVCRQQMFGSEKKKYCVIELSTKVIDSAHRLRDTLLHEMCHAATWIIYGFQDGHGKFWKYWAQESVRVFPNIPKPTVCHNYDINTKYSYKCALCGVCVGRHSKSLDTERKRCGRCGGKFELQTPLRTPSKFALYVKENYGSVKKSNQKSKHGEIMKLLSAEFSSKAKVCDE